MSLKAADEAAATTDNDAAWTDNVSADETTRAAKRAKVVADVPPTAPPTTIAHAAPASSRLVSDASSLGSDDGEGSVATESTANSHLGAAAAATTTALPKRASLRFSFSGYSIWLDLDQHSPHPNGIDGLGGGGEEQEEEKNDLDAAIAYAAERENVHPIPAPHVTVVYGIDHLPEREVLRRFGTLRDVVHAMGGWPDLVAKGLLVDREYDGVDGATMSMAWMEVTLGTSPEHEALVDAVHGAYHLEGDSDSGGSNARSGPWKPHLSLCYDNPEGSPFVLSGAMDVVAKFPSLLNGGNGGGTDDGSSSSGGGGNETGGRRPIGLSLWSTEGTMDQWVCLDRFTFR